jgi:cystathionine beta-lyase/cystathionine gamma-synthase
VPLSGLQAIRIMKLQKQMSGFGGMVSFTLFLARKNAVDFLEN